MTSAWPASWSLKSLATVVHRQLVVTGEARHGASVRHRQQPRRLLATQDEVGRRRRVIRRRPERAREDRLDDLPALAQCCAQLAEALAHAQPRVVMTWR